MFLRPSGLLSFAAPYAVATLLLLQGCVTVPGAVAESTEAIQQPGITGRTVLIYVDSRNQRPEFEQGSLAFSIGLQRHLKALGYDAEMYHVREAKDFGPWLNRAMFQLSRDRTTTVIQYNPLSYRTVNGRHDGGRFAINAYQSYSKGFTAPAYTFKGDWRFNSESTYARLVSETTNRLIANGFLIQPTVIPTKTE